MKVKHLIQKLYSKSWYTRQANKAVELGFNLEANLSELIELQLSLFFKKVHEYLKTKATNESRNNQTAISSNQISPQPENNHRVSSGDRVLGSDQPKTSRNAEVRIEPKLQNCQTLRDESSDSRRESRPNQSVGNGGKSCVNRGEETTGFFNQFFDDTIRHIKAERQLATDSRQLAQESRQLATEARQLAEEAIGIAETAVGVSVSIYLESTVGNPNCDQRRIREIDPTTIEADFQTI